ncbi:MAG: ATP-binding protein [Pseudomonadota bacterium]
MKKLWAGKYSGIVLAIALFVLLVAALLVANFTMAAKFARETEMVNLAARQQTLSQQTVKALLQTDNALGSGNYVDTPLQEFKRSFRLFDETLEAFQNGGEVTLPSGERAQIAALTDSALQAANTQAAAVWNGFKAQAQFVADFEGRIERNADFEIGDIEADLESAMYDAILYDAKNDVSANLLRHINELAVGLEQRAASRARTMQIVQVAGIVMALASFAVIVFVFLRNLRRSDDALAIAEEEKDEILNTVNEGLFLLDEELQIGSQYSRAVETIFRRQDLAGKDFLALLRDIVPEKTLETARDYVGLFFGGRINEKLVDDLNPLDQVEVHFRDETGGFVTRYLGFSFKRVVVNEDLSHLLVTVNDITEIVALRQQLDQSQDQGKAQLDMMMDMLHIEPDVLNDFLSSTDAALEAINTVLKKPGETQAEFVEKLDDIFRRAHGVKGEASALGLSSVATLAHELEDRVATLKDNPSLKGGDFLPLTMRLDELMGHMGSVRKLIEKVAAFRQTVSTDNAGAPAPATADGGERRRKKRHGLTSMLTSLASRLAEDQGKKVRVLTKGFDLRGVPDDFRNALKDICVQFLRNGVTHGIEMPNERSGASKNELGTVSFVIQRDGGKVTLTYRDDGRGLDVERIRDAAKRRGFLTPEQAAQMDERQLMSLIFRRGFSTSETVDENAGRGVGMDVIRHLIRELGGRVRMSTTAGHATEFTVILPLAAGNASEAVA